MASIPGESDRGELSPQKKQQSKITASKYWLAAAILAIIGGFLGLLEIQFGWGLIGLGFLSGVMGLFYWSSAQ